MAFISVVSPCYNEEGNLRELHSQIKAIFLKISEHTYEHIIIDNASTDGSLAILRELARQDKNLKVIVNTRNFGHIRSPFHALLQATGDAVIAMASDLQDPPTLIPEFIERWEKGAKIVLGIKSETEESFPMSYMRKAYYRLVSRLSEIDLAKDFTGFGLYDRRVVDSLKAIDDPYPYFRGLLCDLGFEQVRIPYRQALRSRGITKNNFYTLYDTAMLGITNHSKVPLRLATMIGFGMSALSFLIAVGYLVAKLMFWDQFRLGTAPILIGLFLFASVQLFFIGIVGEYIGAIHTQVQKRPLVIEKERINFK